MAPPAAEPVPESVVVEADHDPVRVPPAAAEEPEPAVPEPVEAEEPEPAVPEPVEPAPETESGEIGEESEPGGTSMPDESEALAPRARRSWRGMTLRRVDPPDATTSGELPAPGRARSHRVPGAPGYGERGPVRRSRRESRPEPEERPAYAPPRGVPPPQPDEVAPVVPRAPANVVRMPQSATPREWNLWELESLAREQARLEPERGEEWSYLFVHLRQFADVEGKLPSDFDGLVRESFGELLDTSSPCEPGTPRASGRARRRSAARRLGALALGGEDGGGVTPTPDQVETAAPWQEAAVGVRGRPGHRTTCGGVIEPNTVGVVHPVLPCGARLVLRSGQHTETAEVVDRAAVGPGRDFGVTRALATRLGLGGDARIRWRFAG